MSATSLLKHEDDDREQPTYRHDRYGNAALLPITNDALRRQRQKEKRDAVHSEHDTLDDYHCGPSDARASKSDD